MKRCAYCKKEAVTEDAIGIPACLDHIHEADKYAGVSVPRMVELELADGTVVDAEQYTHPSRAMKPSDLASWMLFDGVETKPVVYSNTCYICRDSEYARMGLPLCRACPICGGHIAADDTRCDICGLDDQTYYEAIEARLNADEMDEYVFVDEDRDPVKPGWLQRALLRMALMEV